MGSRNNLAAIVNDIVGITRNHVFLVGRDNDNRNLRLIRLNNTFKAALLVLFGIKDDA